jgi:hypothetical protein
MKGYDEVHEEAYVATESSGKQISAGLLYSSGGAQCSGAAPSSLSSGHGCTFAAPTPSGGGGRAR